MEEKRCCDNCRHCDKIPSKNLYACVGTRYSPKAADYVEKDYVCPAHSYRKGRNRDE